MWGGCSRINFVLQAYEEIKRFKIPTIRKQIFQLFHLKRVAIVLFKNEITNQYTLAISMNNIIICADYK